jgi:hypothetical protein
MVSYVIDRGVPAMAAATVFGAAAVASLSGRSSAGSRPTASAQSA